MTESQDPDTIRAAVRDHYAGIARDGGRQDAAAEESPACDCCSPYPVALLDELPARVTDLSLGCGDAVSGAELQPGETVLDLGSGGGIDCFLAARAVGPEGRVIGVDMTPDMLAQARANAAHMEAANVEFRQGEIEALPVSDGSVDVVISNCVINLAPDKQPVFVEIARVLRPGGRVHVSDIVTNGPLDPDVARDLDSWSECVAGALPAEDYAEGLRSAGLVDVVVSPGVEVGERGAVGAGMPYSATITALKPAM
jgi:SAM-dependent methyltransferase